MEDPGGPFYKRILELARFFLRDDDGAVVAATEIWRYHEPILKTAGLADDSDVTTWIKKELVAYVMECEKTKMFRYAMTFLRNPEDAEDALQETAIKALRGIGQFTGANESTLATWLERVLTNECLTILRSKKRRAEVMCEKEMISDQIPLGRNMNIERAVQARILYEMIVANSRPDDIEILTLFFVEGLAHEELQEEFGFNSLSTPRVRILRAKRRVCKHARKKGLL